MEEEKKDEELFIPKTKHKALKIMLAIILIGGLIAGGYFLYKGKFCNPNNTISSIIENIQKSVGNSFNETTTAYKVNGLVKTKATISGEYNDIANLVNNIDFQFNGEIDTKNKLANITLNTKYKEDQLIDIKSYYESNSFYVLLDGVYDKYLKISSDEVKETTDIFDTKIDKSEIKIMINSIIKAIKEASSKLEFKRIDATIKIDDKDTNVYNNYIELNQKELNNLYKDIVNILKKDNDFLKVFKKLTNGEGSLDNLIKDIDDNTRTGTYIFNFYTTKNIINQKLVSIRIETKEEDLNNNINYDIITDDERMITITTSDVTASSRIKKTNSLLNIDLTITEGKDVVNVEIKTNYEKINQVTKPDISNSKNISELTESEAQEIEEKLQSNKGITSFLEDASKIEVLKKIN